MKKNSPLKYNKPLEKALENVFGDKKYHSYASLFEESKHVKSALRDWIKRIRKRIKEVSNLDDELQKILLIRLDQLKKTLADYPRNANEWDIIPNLIFIINHLLGYDYHDGKVHHTIYFFQTETQQVDSLIRRGEIKSKEFLTSSEVACKYKEKLAKQMKKEGLTIFQISEVLSCSPSYVGKLIKSPN